MVNIFFSSWQQLMVGLLLPFFASVDTASSGFKFLISGWKNFTFVTHRKKDRCSEYVLGYLNHFRMQLTIYNNHFLSQIWKLYQEDFARTLRSQTTNQQSLELFSFWIDGHEDTRRPHSWDVPSWMYAIPIPHVGCTDVDLSMDRCSRHLFGLFECGCSCVRPQ